MKKLSKTDFAFLVFLTALISIYSIHLFSFTLFEGFTTFSNDAATYVLLAQKWSPFYTPTDAVLHTYTALQYPPAFPWLLAITGASNSLWAGHLLVSILMLISVFWVGWLIYIKHGAWIAGLLVCGLCFLPGVLISSMGILSENLYLFLSLCIFSIYSYIEKNKNPSWVWFFALALSLALLILTRTIGISFITAILLVSTINRSLSTRQKFGAIVAVFLSISIWIFWGIVNPQTDGATYSNQLNSNFGSGRSLQEIIEFLISTININSVQILSSWNHYITLIQSKFWFFIFPSGLLMLCLIATGLRVVQRRFDAIYIFFYFTIILIWPYPEEIARFLHPVIFFIFLQPIFLLGGNLKNRNRTMVNMALAFIFLALIVNSVFVHSRLIQQKSEAIKLDPELAHTYELYASPTKEFDLMTATNFVDVIKYMVKSAEMVPLGGTVATTKPVNYAILTQKRAVDLVNTVDDLQQLCNLKIKDVDLVFVSALVSGLNWEGHKNAQKYQEIASENWKLEGGSSGSIAYAIVIDKTKLNAKLEQEKYPCLTYQVFN